MSNTTKILICTLCLLMNFNVYAQSILETYYKGNKDSLTKDAARLIQLHEPTFKPAQLIGDWFKTLK